MSTKLVEVALPLEAISKACKADKDRKVGTIKNVHKWFAPMPTPAWRALLFATLIDDPGDEEGRAELLKLITRLVPENGAAPDLTTLEEARKLIQDATGSNPPIVFDPFCGGGSTLIEAQRLGLETVGSDLNPVPVLITRTITDLVPEVAGRPPLHGSSGQLGLVSGEPLDGLLADCAHYGGRVRDKVWEEIGHFYPPAPGGGTVVAWLWARTVRCPNPACRGITPLVSSFWLSKRTGAEIWLKQVHRRPDPAGRFEIASGVGTPMPGTVARTSVRCLVCGESMPLDHVRTEGQSGRLAVQLLALAVDGPAGRRYLAGDEAETTVLSCPRPADAPLLDLTGKATINVGLYGLKTQADLYSSRQLIALGAFADAVAGVPRWVHADGGDEQYATAIASILGLCVGKMASFNSTQGRWWCRNGPSKVQPAFTRHALPMVWDYAEANPFGGSVGDWVRQVNSVGGALQTLPLGRGTSFQADARSASNKLQSAALLATDPPYFAQIGYADLADYFYVWLRRALRHVHPDLFATLATPKADELIGAPHRHGGSVRDATDYFVAGFTETFSTLAKAGVPGLPMLIVYAHRQEQSESGAVSSTAWDAMLTAILSAGIRIVGTWPIRATTSGRQIGIGANALASYVVLVCRPQLKDARIVDRQGFVAALRAELPKAIRKLQEAAVSSIDLGQATIGPGMATFSRFSRVIEPSGQSMSVQSALEMISQVQAEVLDEFVGDLDPATRWAMTWYKDHGFEEGSFDDAEKLSKTTVTAVGGLVAAGIAAARAGKVRLRGRSELPEEWSPRGDSATTVWEVTQHLTQRVASGGEESASPLFRSARRWVDEARALAYWLSGTAAARGRTKDALDYDALVTSWPVLLQKASQDDQPSILGNDG